MPRGNPSSGRLVSELAPPTAANSRRCESCNGAIPDRMARQRDDEGRLVCDSCKGNNMPDWTTTYSSLTAPGSAEMQRREAQTLASIMRVARAQARGLSVVAHDSGDNAIIHHCFEGATEYLTRDGVKTLAETVGTTQWVLTSPRGEKTPRWVEAEIRDFGVQPLLRLTLRRNQQIKIIHATPGHRWLVGRPGGERVVTTADLRPDHRLGYLLTPGVGDLAPSPEGIRHGVIFGDGTVHKGRWARVTLWGEKDKQLLPYFPGTSQRPMLTPGGVAGVSVTGGFTAEMKTVPSLDASDEYLYGWLAGYFAADGHVNTQGQAIIDCASLDTLLAVRDVATRLGISVYSITTRPRQGYGDDPREISRMQFVGSTLNEDFFLIEQHRDRYRLRDYGNERVGWTVVSVEDAEAVENVYCAVVPETESFVLADNIWTMNCPFCGSGAVVGQSDGTATCDFCHTAFTVQVQPVNSFQPQTIGGEPVPPPGMPGDEPTEMSSPEDPTVAEDSDGVAADPLGDAAAPEPEPKGKVPPQFAKASRTAGNEDNKARDRALAEKAKTMTAREFIRYQHGGKGCTCPTSYRTCRWADFWDRARAGYYDEKTSTAVQTSDPNSREEHPYPDMGDYVVIADAIRRFIRAGLFSSYEEAKRSGVVERLRVDGIQSNLTTEQKVQEVLSSKQSSLHTAETHTASGFSEPDDILCPDCGQEMSWFGDDGLPNRCPHCGAVVKTKPAPTNSELDADHIPVSVEGWTCDICGVPVNGQTNDLGHPVQRGDSVRHTGSKKAYRTAEGHTLDEHAYMARLALAHADDRDEVLDAVRLGHMQREAFESHPEDPAVYDDLLAREPVEHGDVLNPEARGEFSLDLLESNGYPAGPDWHYEPKPWQRVM